MTGFGFVEFENSKDAEDVVNNFNGKSFMGSTIAVEFAKESRPRRDPYDDRDRGDRGGDRGDRGFGSRARRPPGVRVIVTDVSRDTSWQDLKDFGRDAGNVTFADINHDVPGQGILEYVHREDASRAVKELDGKDLRGRPVHVAFDDARSGPDNYRRDDRDRRRDRSRSPRRDDDRRPPRRDYDDRRHHDDRRDSDRRDDRRRDDRRRDDGDSRRDDGDSRPGDSRPGDSRQEDRRPSNGDRWSR